MPEIEFFQLTDVGCVREGNEDAVGHWPHEDGLLIAVADGLGGHAAGEVASALALEVLAREMDRAPGSWALTKRLRRAVQEANLELYNKAIVVPELRGMGTTLTASAVVGGTLVAAHVGDCRLFLWREGALTQLTKDHTWVWEQMQYGLLSPEAARAHPRRSMLTRCLGRELIVGIDVLSMDLRPGAGRGGGGAGGGPPAGGRLPGPRAAGARGGRRGQPERPGGGHRELPARRRPTLVAARPLSR